MRTEQESPNSTSPVRSWAAAGVLHGNVPDAFVKQLAMADVPMSPGGIKAAHMLVAGTLSPRTRTRYGMELAQVSKWCAEHGLDLLGLTPLDVGALVVACRDAGRSPKRMLMALSFVDKHRHQPPARVTALAYRADLVWRARFRDRLPSRRQAAVLPLRAWHDIRAAVLLGRDGQVHPYDLERFYRDRFIVSLGVCAGVRPGEFGLLSASRSRISSDGRRLILPLVTDAAGAATTKTGRSEIVVPLGVAPFDGFPLREDFEQLRALRVERSGEMDRLVGDAWNYGRLAGLGNEAVTPLLRRLGKRAGISDASLLTGGSLRRSMVHIAAAAGWSPGQIAAVTGHASPVVVERSYLDGYGGAWTRSSDGRRLLLEGSDGWEDCPLNVDSGQAERPPNARARCWWLGRDLDADRATAMDLARGTPRVAPAARRMITRAGNLWEDFCARVGADPAAPTGPLIEAFCIDLTRGGATGRYRTTDYLTDYFAAHPSIPITEIPHLEKLVRAAVHLGHKAVKAHRLRTKQPSRRRIIVPVTDEAMKAVFGAPLRCQPEGLRLCGVVLAHGESRLHIPARQRSAFRFGAHTRLGDDVAELLMPPLSGSPAPTDHQAAIVVTRGGGDPLWCPVEAVRTLQEHYADRRLPQALAQHPWALHCGSLIRWLQARAAVAVLYAIGLRPCDLYGIRWSDLRVGADGTIVWRLPSSKGNKTGDRVQVLRLAPTGEPWCPVTALGRLAESLREARSAGWVGATSEPDSDGIVRRVFNNGIGRCTAEILLRPAGVDIRCQDFRYRKAAQVLAASRDMQMVRATLFHSEAQVSAGYVQRGLPSRLRSELDALSGVFATN